MGAADKLSQQLPIVVDGGFFKTCTPITYDVDDAETTVALLSSKELDVIARALRTLCVKVDQAEDLLPFLIAKDVYTKVNELFHKHREICILRYTLKLLATIVNTPENIKKVNQETLCQSIPTLLHLYFFNKDDFVKEASSLIVIKLITNDPLLSFYVCSKKILRRIIKILEISNDPDVLINSLQLFLLLMEIDLFQNQLVHIKRDHLNVLLCYVQSDIDEIGDLAMNILHRTVTMNVEGIAKTMANGKTLHIMVKIVVENKKRYVRQATDIIAHCVKDRKAALLFTQSMDFQRLLDFFTTCDNNSLLRLIPIYSTLTHYPSITKKLYSLSAEETFIKLLKYRHETIVLNICQIISNMSTHKDCCNKILNQNVLKTLLDIFKKFPMDPCGIASIKAIHSFAMCNSKSLKLLSMSGTLEEIQRIFLDDEDNYPEVVYKLALITMDIMVSSQLVKKLDRRAICIKILDLLRKHYPMKKEILKMINMLMQCKLFRDQFMDSNGPAYFISTLQKNTYNDDYQLNLKIVHSFVKYEDIAAEFLELGCMSLMKSMINKGSRLSGIYQDIIDSLYESCLSIKYFDKKFLCDDDFIGNLFYFIQENLLRPTDSNFNPIYVVNIQSPFEDDSDSSFESRISVDDRRLTLDNVILKVLRNHSQGMRNILAYSLCEMDIENQFLVRDCYLEKYIIDLHNEIYTGDFEVEKRMEIIAKYVNRQLSGITFSDIEEERRLTFDKHIQSIIANLGHRFIPLGYLRMGYICEKALLFKVLCDHLGIPTAFYKKDGFYWNEVEIWHGRKRYNNTFIMDLKDDIGMLIVKNSSAGDNYLGFCAGLD